mgnify:CR=1 FL=1
MHDLTSLRYFISAFESRTFSQAARAQSVSQPTVSAAIQKMEDRLGVPLFHRAKSGLTPTPLATRLYHDVIESVEHLATLDARMRVTQQQVVRVHCAADMLLHGLAPALNALRRTTPNLDFHFTEDPRDSDIAYLSAPCVPKSHGFVTLAEEPFQIALARHHPQARSPGIRVEDLHDHSLILRPYCPNADRLDLSLAQGTTAQAQNDAQLLDLVAARLGIGFVPRSHGDSRDDIVLRPLLGADAGTRTIGIAHKKSAFATKMANRLIEILAPPPKPTAEVSLVVQTPDHAPGLFAALSDPRIYTHLDEAPPISVKAVEDHIRRVCAGLADGQELWLNWSVFLGGPETKNIVGYTQATVTVDGASGITTASIAYVFSHEVWGKGVAQSAVEQMMNILVQGHNTTRFVADTEVGNLASQGLLKRLGFHEVQREAGEVFYVKEA